MRAPSRRAACLFVLASFGAGHAAAAAPLRVVSLNPCLDTILVHLAEREQIAALSHYAREPNASTIADIARTLPFTYETAEEILGLRPDIVLASQHSSRATSQALARMGVRLVEFGVPNSVDESLGQISQIGRLIGREQRARLLLQDIERALIAAAPRDAHPPIRAIVFQARGLVAGEGTLTHEMLQRTGFENVAARYGVRHWGNVSLERLIADPPDLLLAAPAEAGAQPFAERLLSHPALRSITARMQRANFPEAYLYCGGPVLLQTAPLLAQARDAYWSGA